MKVFAIVAVLSFAAGTATAADVGLSISVAQPGLYGRIDIGNVPAPPPIILPSPIVVERAPVAVVREPVYLHVPPGHEKHWDKHCREYNACGVPVYFVQDRWYNDVYVPRARAQAREPAREAAHGNGHGNDHGNGKSHGKGHGHDD